MYLEEVVRPNSLALNNRGEGSLQIIQHLLTWLNVFSTQNGNDFSSILQVYHMTEKSSASIDAIDVQIMKELQKDGRATNAKISKRVGKGISTVHARIKALREHGYIERFTAVLDPKKLERGTTAFILVTVTYRVPGGSKVISQREFCKDIAGHRLVQAVHVLSGEYDVLLKVRARDIEEMNRFIVDFLRKKPAVDKTLTMFAMDTYLDTLALRGLKGIPE